MRSTDTEAIEKMVREVYRCVNEDAFRAQCRMLQAHLAFQEMDERLLQQLSEEEAILNEKLDEANARITALDNTLAELNNTIVEGNKLNK